MDFHRIWLSLIFPMLLMLGDPASGQTPKGMEANSDAPPQTQGKTYALIVGISKYQFPECYPSLHYADVDARNFFNYMTSKSGGNVDPGNIDTLFNAGA